MGMGQNETTGGPQVLVHVSIYQGNPFWARIFDPQPNPSPTVNPSPPPKPIESQAKGPHAWEPPSSLGHINVSVSLEQTCMSCPFSDPRKVYLVGKIAQRTLDQNIRDSRWVVLSGTFNACSSRVCLILGNTPNVGCPFGCLQRLTNKRDQKTKHGPIR